MAALWADTPDYYSLNEITRGQWTSFTNTGVTASIAAGAGRRAGTNAWRNGVGGAKFNQWLKTLTPSGDAIIAFAFKLRGGLSAPNYPWFGIGDATVWHLTANFNADQTIQFRNGGTPGGGVAGTVIGSTSIALALNVWYHLSIRAKIDDAAGTLSCRINRVEALNGGAGYTGIDTRNAGTAAWTRFAWATADAQHPNFDFADVVACDSSGALNNDHPGDCAVLVQLPATGNGGNADFTPSSGTDHGALVREAAAPDDDTTYVAGASSGQRDTFVYPAIAFAGTPRFIINRPCLKLSVAGALNALDVCRKGGVNYDGTAAASPTAGGYTYFDFLRELDPSTGAAWTMAGINAAESGVKVQ
jgi:hypothetical protein